MVLYKVVAVLLSLAISLPVSYAQTGCGAVGSAVSNSWECIYAFGLIQSAYQFRDDRHCPTQVDLEKCFNVSSSGFEDYYSSGCHCASSITNAAFAMSQPDYVIQAFTALPTNQSTLTVAGAHAQGYLERKLLQDDSHVVKFCTTQYYRAFLSHFSERLYDSASTRCPDAGQARINLRPNTPQANPPIIEDNAIPINIIPGVVLPEAWIDAGVAKDTRDARQKNISDGEQLDLSQQFSTDYDRQGPQQINGSIRNAYTSLGMILLTLLILICLV